jgi:glutamyl/glutaminyl-tRNA synthetase
LLIPFVNLESALADSPYRGRLAPSPTGYLHLGHARTFWTAQERARQRGGTLVLRNEDLDSARCKSEFVAAMIEDLRWFGLEWQEGPDGPDKSGFAPYHQSGRFELYRLALEQLRATGFVYPCTCSRKDIQQAVTAPHTEGDEPIYPGTCRPKPEVREQKAEDKTCTSALRTPASGFRFSWRFRVPDGEIISFTDGNFGLQEFVAGKDFGDFVVWSHRDRADVPAYQLACVVDDAAMQITEVVRGADLLVSTSRQILLYRALDLKPPAFFHCPLLRDATGERLAKRHDALSLRVLRAAGKTPESIRRDWS